jgi:hypothetical protein
VNIKYRIYIDETGNPDLDSSENPLHRYLGLTGIIVDLDTSRHSMAQGIDELKRKYFSIEYDEPIILHRKDIIQKKPPFNSLVDPAIEARFNNDLLGLLSGLPYKVITVVLDKLEHKQRYTVWRHHPYHRCLEVLLERFVMFLEANYATGDVLAESRGGKEDMKLKDSFQRLYNSGTEYVDHTRFSTALTSSQIKIKPKSANIAALQIADLIAHPSRQEILSIYRKLEYGTEKFGYEIIRILNESKYDRSADGRINGFGRKFLP